MQYLALIYADEGAWDALGEEARADALRRTMELADRARAGGAMVAGSRLGPTRDATTVRVREAQTLVTDGPYAETRETLGGTFLLECESIDEACAWAAQIPAAARGAVEVRPVHRDPEEEHL